MASSADDRPKIELARHDPAASTGPQPAAAAAATDDQHPAMGYPPVIGYPQGDPRYPGPYAYPYPGPPPPPLHEAYPGLDTLSGQLQVERRRLLRFSCCTLAIFCIFLITATVVIHIVLHPRMPDFILSDFSVSDLTISNDSVLLASWEANVTVENQNSHVRLELDMVEGSVYDSYPERYLSSMSGGGTLILGKRSSGMMGLKMATLASQQPDVKVVEAVRDELRSNRTVTVSLAMELAAKFKYSWWWKKHATELVYCEDLTVEFTTESGSDYSGSLAATARSWKCLLRTINYRWNSYFIRFYALYFHFNNWSSNVPGGLIVPKLSWARSQIYCFLVNTKEKRTGFAHTFCSA